MKAFAFALLTLCLACATSAAELTVDLGRGISRYQTQALLDRKDVRTVVIPADVAFQRTMRYRALPLTALLGPISAGEQLQFVATDGFAANIPAALILNQQGSQAWLAIEDPRQPWPALGKSGDRAGPFYVVWTHPRAAGVNPEQWPYQLASIRKAGDIASRFPAMVPGPGAPPGGAVQRGFLVFQHTCLACHTLNRQGDARLGPDLNVPHNPTEYLSERLLRAYIRNPQSLHDWPQAKMHGLDRQALPEADLDAVLAYLRHMAKQKVQ
jgi:mono/diheme cytochrome c family protein